MAQRRRKVETTRKRDSADLSHLDAEGRPHMVDVSGKPPTQREAVARGRIELSSEGWKALQRRGGMGKGDPLAVAQVAAIQAAKRTSEWIPLAHPLPLRAVDVAWTRRARLRILEVEVRVRVEAATGVEMEALTACAAGLLTVYDMLKAVDRAMVLGPIWLVRKRGGRGGPLRLADPELSRHLRGRDGISP